MGGKTDFNALVDQVQHVHDVTSSYVIIPGSEPTLVAVERTETAYQLS